MKMFDKNKILWGIMILVLPVTLRSIGSNQICPKPNVVLILTDDQGYPELSVHGNPILVTPNLDKLAEESVRFSDFHAAPMCAPSRGQLMTGRDAVANGLINVSSGRALLRPELPTMGTVFMANGYKTGIFGKWHLGDNYPYRPQDRGFEESIWFPSSHISSLADFWGNNYFDDTYWHNGKREKFEGYCTDVFFHEATKFMVKSIKANKPFFVYLPTNTPHSPLKAKQDDLKILKKAYQESSFADNEELGSTLIPYLAMIKNIDNNIGNLINFLSNQSIMDNTIVIFLTDNGSTQGYRYFNANMRGRKCDLWDGGHRVPFFIRWPNGSFKNIGKEVKGLAEIQDIFPTLMDLCGLKKAMPVQFDGVSLASVLRGRSQIPENRMLYINYSRMPDFIDYPAPFGQTRVRKEGAAVLWKEWRLLESRELYNRKTDPLQKNNVYAQYPTVVNKMMSGLDKWWENIENEVNKFQRIIIGTDYENPTILTACDWLDVFVDQQRQVSNGVYKNSYWCLEVAREGDYEFELRRWPKETDSPIKGQCQKADRDGHLGGKTLAIHSASLYIGGINHRTVSEKNPYQFEGLTKNVNDEDKKITFEVHLDPGPIYLHTFFNLENDEGTIGAYYVYVKRK